MRRQRRHAHAAVVVCMVACVCSCALSVRAMGGGWQNEVRAPVCQRDVRTCVYMLRVLRGRCVLVAAVVCCMLMRALAKQHITHTPASARVAA